MGDITTTTMSTGSGTISNRCETSWVHANSHCGTRCEYTDDACPSGQRCFAGLTLACPTDFFVSSAEVAPLESEAESALLICGNGWQVKGENSDVSSSWCETTCSEELCDLDLCECIPQ